MAEHGVPALFVLFLWWFTTGAILYLDGLRRDTFRWTMLGATTLLLAALVGLHATAGDTSSRGAYLAFVAGVLVWGWIELAFLTGLVTGPRRTACPEGARGFTRLKAALGTLLWHELAILVAALLIWMATSHGENRIGLYTFLAFWLMRQSAKINVYLGVRNLAEAFLPDHLRYLESFFRRRPMNWLLPVSVLAGIATCFLLMRVAVAPGATPHEVAGYTLLAALVALGVVEHLFMVAPVPADALWRWGLSSRNIPPTPANAARATGGA
jgi:putative photosynthetic complex assembly protein 2